MITIKELAIEPDSIVNWSNYQRIENLLGIDKGRVTVLYPSNWLMTFLEKCDELPDGFSKKVIKDKITDIWKDKFKRKAFFIEKDCCYDNKNNWSNNAISNHDFFDCIISEVDNPQESKLINYNKIYSDHPLLKVKVQDCIPREAEIMAQNVAMFLKQKRILFIDPHMEGFKRRHTDFLKACFEYLNFDIDQEIEIHVGNDERISNEDMELQLDRFLLPFLPGNLASFKIYRHPGNLMHNRYVLTELGGIKFGTGLDTHNNNPNTNQEDDISILSIDSNKKHWLEYTGGFEVVYEKEFME